VVESHREDWNTHTQSDRYPDIPSLKTRNIISIHLYASMGAHASESG